MKDVADQMIVDMMDLSYQLDQARLKVYTYEALLYEIGKEKFIIEDEIIHFNKRKSPSNNFSFCHLYLFITNLS
ncbi:hypothetical protein [Halobacillus litoralis]|uniref:hypothetical protein n=1 Tax=Halobacillus litoralis TaxID=45668 RepID=UPI001CD30C98|nr:hypothetical protein [Halobacillus litoralis]MCA1021764.1 hypothetical protein [Halobacillus litoralis]